MKFKIESVELQLPYLVKVIIKKKGKTMESSSILLSSKHSDFITNFNPPLVLSSKKQYELALVSLDTYYSFPNIDASNNKFVYSVDGGVTWETIVIPEGSYEIADINGYIKSALEQKHGVAHVEISPNTNTLRCVLKISDPLYRVSFQEDATLRDALGFDSRVYLGARQEGERTVDILKLNSILVHCDVVAGSTVNGQSYPTLYSFFPNVAPGYKIVETPHNLVYLPVTTDYIRSIRVWLTSQNEEEMLNLRGETITLRLHLRTK